MLKDKKVLILMSGSISCVKAILVASQLKKNNCEVKIAVTPNTLNFIGPSTFRGIVGEHFYCHEWESSKMEHIELERWADLIVLCPATANRINLMKAGIANDLVANIWLAHNFKKKFLVFPAMNAQMWNHPTTKESVNYLKDIGVKFYGPNHGNLACGEEGEGRLLEYDEIVKIIEKELSHQT